MRRIIVLTGCTRGCGKALLDRFAEAGHVVAGCGRGASEIDELRQTRGAPHRFDVVDVSNAVVVEQWSRAVIDAVGVPDLLVNNAAVINRPASLWELSAEEFDRVVDINVKGIANTIRGFLPAMIEAGRGVVVNFSSGWGRSTSSEVAPYCATKFAVEGLSDALAKELPPDMACVALNPGVINTEMLQSCWAGSADSCPSPDEWSRSAAPFILGLSASDNGKSLNVS